MKLGEIIKQYRNDKKMSMEKFAETANLSKGYISMLEKGINPQTKKPISPALETIQNIAKAMNIDFENLISLLDDSQLVKINSTPSQAPDELVTAINDKVVQLTTDRKKNVLRFASDELDAQNTETDIEEELYTYRVYERLSAGTGTGYYEDGDYDTVYYDEDLTHDLASWIYGDSMEPKYLNGEVALIKADGFDYDGAVYAVSWAGQTFIKKVYLEEDGYRLVSLNQKYAPLFAHKDEDPRIIGRVVGNFKPMER